MMTFDKTRQRLPVGLDSARVLTCRVPMKTNRINFLPKTRPMEKSHTDHKDLVWVQCQEHRCMAYMDAAGKWINFYTNKKLKNFVSVIG
jgi:hypothetical protein